MTGRGGEVGGAEPTAEKLAEMLDSRVYLKTKPWRQADRVWRCYDREMGRNEWTDDEDLAAIRRSLPDEWVVTEFTASPGAPADRGEG